MRRIDITLPPYSTLPLALIVGFVVTKVARVVSPDGSLDALALLVGVAVVTVIAFTLDAAVKRPRGR